MTRLPRSLVGRIVAVGCLLGAACDSAGRLQAAEAERLWSSPTSGPPIRLNHLPRNVAAVVAFRPAEIVKHAEHERLIDPWVIGTLADQWKTTLPQWAGTTHDQIEQVVLGLFAARPAHLAACVIYRKQPATIDELVKSWRCYPTPEQLDGRTIYVRGMQASYQPPFGDGKVSVAPGAQAFYLPPEGNGKVIVVAPYVVIAEIIALKGAPPPLLGREFDSLLRTSDADRHFTVALVPAYLETREKTWTDWWLEPGIAKLRWLLTGGNSWPPAVVFSAHLATADGTDRLFWELRVYDPNAKASDPAAVEPLAARLRQTPDLARKFFLDSNPPRNVKEVLFNFPGAVRFCVNNARFAVGLRQLIVCGVAPDVAAHNLVLGGRLCLLEASGPALKPEQDALTILRTRKMSLAFERNDLNKVLDVVSAEIGIPFEMHGDDFRDAGITKNQSMGMNEIDKPVIDILQVILKKADRDGRLVAALKPAPDGSAKILILTRKGAAARKEKLLAEFDQTAPKSAADILRSKRISLAFDRNDLNKVVYLLATEIGVPIEMHGDDFRAAGITKNQSMGLSEMDKPAMDVLKVILLKADPTGRLVAAIKPGHDGKTEMILIMTREGAAARKEKLLPGFALNPFAQ